nr:MAG TPA: hypothetical protein [Bacteriophage sp.]
MIAILLTICLLISMENLVPIHLDRCLTKQFL